MQYSNAINVLRELGNQVQGSHPERILLLSLYDTAEDVVHMGQLAERIGMSRGATTSIVDRLERQGYVKRSHDIDDRRIVIAAITHNGKLAVNRAVKASA